MGMPEWRVAHLSDIPYVLNLDVDAGGDNSPQQRELSAQLSGSIAAFAWTADPNVVATKGSMSKGLNEWPAAYEQASETGREEPDEVNVFVVGGGLGSGAVKETMGGSGIAEMAREKAARWEKVVERCKFINSITEEIGV